MSGLDAGATDAPDSVAGDLGEAAGMLLGGPEDLAARLGLDAAKVAIHAVEHEVAKGVGRAGKQARLKELAINDKLGSADRGWIKQEINSIKRGKRKNIRNPPGKDLAHERGREAAKGYSYKHSHLQNRIDHRLQHKHDNWGRKNKDRPPY